MKGAGKNQLQFNCLVANITATNLMVWVFPSPPCQWRKHTVESAQKAPLSEYESKFWWQNFLSPELEHFTGEMQTKVF